MALASLDFVICRRVPDFSASVGMLFTRWPLALRPVSRDRNAFPIAPDFRTSLNGPPRVKESHCARPAKPVLSPVDDNERSYWLRRSKTWSGRDPAHLEPLINSAGRYVFAVAQMARRRLFSEAGLKAPQSRRPAPFRSATASADQFKTGEEIGDFLGRRLWRVGAMDRVFA